MIPLKLTIIPDDAEGWKMAAIVDGKPLGYHYSEAEIGVVSLTWVLGGKPKGEATPADRLLMNILLAEAIPEEEYHRLVKLGETAPPWHPRRRPREPIRLSSLPPLGRR